MVEHIALAVGSMDFQVCGEGEHAQRALTDLLPGCVADFGLVGIHLALQVLAVSSVKEDNPIRVVGSTQMALCVAPPEA